MPRKSTNMTKSVYRGVHRVANKNRWRVSIFANRKKQEFGPYKSEISAAKAYDKYALKFHKHKAVLNFGPNPLKIEKDKIEQEEKEAEKQAKKIKNHYAHKRKQFPLVTRQTICAKQGWNCNFCGDRLGSLYIVDHMVPLFLGGTNEEYNLQSICPTCDKFKTSYIDYKILKPISQKRKLKVDDVIKAQKNHYYKMKCIKPALQDEEKIPQDVTEDKTTSTNLNNNDLNDVKGKSIDLDLNGVKIRISVPHDTEL